MKLTSVRWIVVLFLTGLFAGWRFSRCAAIPTHRDEVPRANVDGRGAEHGSTRTTTNVVTAIRTARLHGFTEVDQLAALAQAEPAAVQELRATLDSEIYDAVGADLNHCHAMATRDTTCWIAVAIDIHDASLQLRSPKILQCWEVDEQNTRVEVATARASPIANCIVAALQKVPVLGTPIALSSEIEQYRGAFDLKFDMYKPEASHTK